MKQKLIILATLFITLSVSAQGTIPIDTTNWNIQAKSYVLENYKGKDAIYLKGGSMSWKNNTFLNGTIEFDLYLKEEQAFPGVYFRVDENLNGEQFYIRPHLSEKPDGNQVAPITNGITAWQLYFGSKYSFPYKYKYNDWTHVKITVNGDRAQIFLDGSRKASLSWKLFHIAKAGKLTLRGGNRSGMHIANIKIDKSKTEIKDFKPGRRKSIKGIIKGWEISDPFQESLLKDISKLKGFINSRVWRGKVVVEEGVAANVSRKINITKDRKKNTVFARIIIDSKKKQTKYFEFGYSDRVMAVLNGRPIYKGTNKYRSRDYRYLGTVGLFDGIYLNLKKGKNVLLMAVSEDFGGWLITGRFKNDKDVSVVD